MLFYYGNLKYYLHFQDRTSTGLLCCFTKCQGVTQISKDTSEDSLAYLVSPFIKKCTSLAFLSFHCDVRQASEIQF